MSTIKPVAVISSTVRDLPEHRKQVIDACHRCACDYVWMETLPASNDDAVEASMALVDKADVYIGIFGHRYGYVPAGSDISITEMEYNRAKERGIPCLIFFIHDEHPLTKAMVETGHGAEKLEKFKQGIGVNHVAAFFKSAEDLRAHALHALPVTLRKLQPPEGAGMKQNWSKADVQFLREYLKAAVNALNRVELIGADIEHDVRCSELLQAFVMLNLNHRRSLANDNAESVEERSKQASGNLVNARTALDYFLRPGACGRLLIRGSAGMGKTTLVKWAAIWTSSVLLNVDEFLYRQLRFKWPLGVVENDQQSDPSVVENDQEFDPYVEKDKLEPEISAWRIGWHTCTPLVVFLRDYNGEIPPVEEFTRFAGTIIAPPPRWVERVLRAGRALVFLDGIDEVPLLQRERLKGQIKTLVETYPTNYFVLTSRPQAIRQGWLESLGFAEAEVAPMSIHDRDEFIRRWFAAVADYTDMSPKKKAQMPQIAKALIAKLAETPGLTEVTANPLFCGVTCALFYERREVPENIAKLCEQLCWMLHKRERPDGEHWLEKFPAAYVKLSYDQKKFLTGQLAVATLETDRSTITVPDARETIREGLRRIPGADSGEARDVLNGLHERYGLLREASPPREDQPATLAFVHNTFKEFLAGARIAAAGDPKLLLANVDHDSWRRTSLFALATTDNVTFKNEFLRAFLHKLPDTLPRKWEPKDIGIRDRALFALRCWTFATGCDSDVLDRLALLSPQLLPPSNAADAEWLAAAGNDIVGQLRRTPHLTEQEAVACIRTLRLINTRDARAALRAYKIEKRWEVLEELSAIFNPLSLPAVVAHLSTEGPLPESIAEQVRDLSPLANSTEIKELCLDRLMFTDLSPLAGLTNLRALWLNHTLVTDLSPLAKLACLEWLMLDSTPVSNLVPLAELAKLESLWIENTHVSDLSPLAELTNLKSLWIDNTPVSDLSPLANLASLECLSLRQTDVADLSPLSGLTNLRELYIDGFNDTDVSALMPFIRDLNINKPEIADWDRLIVGALGKTAERQ